MADSLSFGRAAATSVWSGNGVVLARVGLSADGPPLGKPVLHERGHAVAASDIRLPGHPDDMSAHDALFDALEKGTFPDALDGEFAIAAWDSRRSALTLARDRVGIRPLFFARPATGCIAFASFPDAIVDSGLVEGRFSRDRIADRILGADYEDPTETWINGVFRLPPGHTLTIEAGGERLRRYWRFPVGQASRAHGDRASAARALRRELEGAVSRALPERSPIFSHLSGGLDSAGVTALAARLCGRAPAEVSGCCFTMPESYRGLGAIDEQPTAEPVAQRIGVTFLTFPFDAVRDALLGPLAHAFVIPDHPDFPYNRIVAHAAARGADRVLCGFGGDEVVSFNGQSVVLADFLALRWRALLRTGRELREPLWRALRNQAANSFLPHRLDQLLRRVLGKPLSYGRLRDDLVKSRFRLGRGPARPALDPSVLQRRHLETAAFWERLETQAWQSARHGVRYVFPFLDWRLLEFASTVPPRLQVHAGMGRALYRAAMADLLPREMIERRIKLNPTPATTYQFALYRDELIAEARRVAASEAASAVVDLAEIERRLAALPEPETVAEAIRGKAAEGLQYRDLRAVSILTPFSFARALAQNEADCAARRWTNPDAA